MQALSHRANALFNLMGGVSTGLMVLVLPYLLNRILTQTEYAIWALGFQAAIYIPMFGLGIHQLLNRSIANSLAQGADIAFRRNIAAGFWIITILSCIGLLFVWISSFFVSKLAQVSASDASAIQMVWAVVGSAASVGLFALFFFGYFGGRQRYEWENLYRAVISIGFIGIISAAHHIGLTISPIFLATLYFFVIACGLLMLTWKFFQHDQLGTSRSNEWHFPTIKILLNGMYGLSVWQFGILMVSGFDVWIVAKIDFTAVPGYSIALSFLAFISGAIAAIIGPCLPRFAAQLGSKNYDQFKETFLGYQKLLLLACLTIFLVITLIPNSIWQSLLRESALTFEKVFLILLIATCLRISTMLYSLAIVAANLQTRVILSPLLEGFVNLFLSIALGFWIGPVGVAIGTLCGAIICLLFHCIYNIPRLKAEIPLSRVTLIFPWIKHES